MKNENWLENVKSILISDILLKGISLLEVERPHTDLYFVAIKKRIGSTSKESD